VAKAKAKAKATRSAFGVRRCERGSRRRRDERDKNICLTDGTGRSIGESLFCACAMRRFVKEEPAKKPLLTRAR